MRVHLPHLSTASAEAITEFGDQPWTVCGYCWLQRTFAQVGFCLCGILSVEEIDSRLARVMFCQTNTWWLMGMTGQSTCLQFAFIRSSSILPAQSTLPELWKKFSNTFVFLSEKYTRTAGIPKTAVLEQAQCDQRRKLEENWKKTAAFKGLVY